MQSGANAPGKPHSTTTRPDSQIPMTPPPTPTPPARAPATPRHFLDFADLSADEARETLHFAAIRKKQGRITPRLLRGRFLLMLMARPSTRTRVSFAAAMAQGGGTSATLDFAASQISRGESPADAARAISAMCDAVVIRADDHAHAAEFAQNAQCPVINGLTRRSHPCQVLADLQTFIELRGDIQGKKIAWIGDANNVFFSWAQAAEMLDFELALACPPQFKNPDAPDSVHMFDAPRDAVKNAELVMTDVWTSMGDEDDKDEKNRRAKIFRPYRVDSKLMAQAAKRAIFMHCLPAHRGEEVTAKVLDGRQSAVWTQAENRMHSQRALLEFLLPRLEFPW